MKSKFDIYSLMTLPESKNFSEYNTEGDFEKSDNGAGEEGLYQKLYTEQMVLEISSNLNDKQKIVFLFQIIREFGFNLSQEDCAKTLNIGRASYSGILNKVQNKAQKIIKASNNTR